MKRILIIALVLLSALSKAQTVGIKVAAPIIKNSPSDNTVTGYANLLNGGYHTVLTIAGRDSLVSAYSKTLNTGMIAYVSGVDSTYRWNGSAWSNVSLSNYAQLQDGLVSGGDATIGTGSVIIAIANYRINKINYTSAQRTFTGIANSPSGTQYYLVVYAKTSSTLDTISGARANIAVVPSNPINTIRINTILVGSGGVVSSQPDLSGYAKLNGGNFFIGDQIISSGLISLNGNNIPLGIQQDQNAAININANFRGNGINLSKKGGAFRIDLRDGNSKFQFINRNAGSSAIGNSILTIDSTGNVNIPSGSNYLINGVPINSGTVTSITPSFGFTSTTPITTSGTLKIDSTQLATKANTKTLAQTQTALNLKANNNILINGQPLTNNVNIDSVSRAVFNGNSIYRFNEVSAASINQYMVFDATSSQYRLASPTQVKDQITISSVKLRPVSTITPTISGQPTRISFVTETNQTVPLDVVIYFHGSSEDQNAAFTDLNEKKITDLLIQKGYLVASSFASGNNWGNQAAQNNYFDLYSYLKSNYNVRRVYFIGQSMGGLSSLNLLLSSRVPVSAWYGIYPVTNLRNMYTGILSANIEAAYGFSGSANYAAATAGYDPNIATSSLYRNKKYRTIASYSDTTVPRLNNSDSLGIKVLPIAPINIETHIGEHGDASAFLPNDILSFFSQDFVYDKSNLRLLSNFRVNNLTVDTVVTAPTFVGALTGNASTATTAATVTTAAQPNITSVGTLTSLTSSGSGTFGIAQMSTWSANSSFARFGHSNFNTLSNYGFLQRNTGDNYIEGISLNLSINGVPKYTIDVNGNNTWNGTGIFADKLTLKAGTTSSSPLRIPSGVAPTAPNDGDVWRLTGRTQLYDGTVTKDVIFDKANSVLSGFGVGAVVTDNLGNLSVAPSADRVIAGVITKTSAYTVTLSDVGSNGTVLVRGDATSAAFTITLPVASTTTGLTFIIKKIDSSANGVTVSVASTIDGTSTKVFNTQYSGASIMSNGTSYNIVATF